MHHKIMGLDAVDQNHSPTDEGFVVVRYPIEDSESGEMVEKVALTVASDEELVTVVLDKSDWDALTSYECVNQDHGLL